MKTIGLSYDDLEHLGIVHYQHANLDIEGESPSRSPLESNEVAHFAQLLSQRKNF